jgi:hypothetical protein
MAAGPPDTTDATASASADDSDSMMTLTTPCLLRYVAQYPQHVPFVQAALRVDGYALEHLAGSAFAADRACVLAAVASCGGALQFAAPALRSDPEVLAAAIASDPFALAHAASSLRAEPGLVLAAVERDPATLALADGRLFADAAFMLVSGGCRPHFAIQHAGG